LKQEGSVSDVTTGRKLIIQVVIDGYPTPVVCEAQLQYIRADPSFLDVSWADKTCEEQDWLVRVAQFHYLKGSSATSPLTPKSDLVANLLKRWIEQDRIQLSDIQHLEMRDKVSHLLEVK